MLLPDTLTKIAIVQFCLLLTSVRSEDHRPLTGHVYFAIAATPSAQSFSRAFNKTLMNITSNYLAGRNGKVGFNVSLETIVIDLPENGSFSAILLEGVCEKLEEKRVVAVLIIGHSPAAFTVSITAKHAGIPVLWARGNGQFMPGFKSLDSSPLEVHLAPTGRELAQALRGLLLQAHWHTFTLLAADQATATALRRPELWQALDSTPLHPTLVALPTPIRPQTLFRKLADISRSSRGVVILLSDRASCIRILEDAKRLNMMDGHFVWVWIDTAAVITVKNTTTDDEKDKDKDKEDRLKRSIESDISDMHVNYLLRNDQFLLFNNHNHGVESSKLLGDRFNPQTSRSLGDQLPPGLLSVKPLPVKVDRHLVKGAVRLLVYTLKQVLSQSPEWMLDNLLNGLNNGCWKNNGREISFISEFARYV